jgi:hypothetical protein
MSDIKSIIKNGSCDNINPINKILEITIEEYQKNKEINLSII